MAIYKIKQHFPVGRTFLSGMLETGRQEEVVSKDLFNRIIKQRDCHTLDKSKVRNDISIRLCEERSDVAISNDL